MSNIIGSFLAGLMSWEKEKTQALLKEQEINAHRNLRENQPMGMYTGNTVAEVNNSTLAPDNPTRRQVEMVSEKGSVGDWRKKFYAHVAAVESPTKGYVAENKKTGAYGKYQFTPSIAKWVAKKSDVKYDEWKKPENQEKMMDWLTNFNIRGLKRKNIPVTEETLWWAHNQGLSGAIALYRGGKVKKENLQMNAGKDEESYKKAWNGKFSDAVINSVAKSKSKPKPKIAATGEYDFSDMSQEDFYKWISADES